MLTTPGFRLPLIPVDIVVNTLITSTWYAVTKKKTDDIFIVNCAVDYEKLPLAAEELLGEVMNKRDKYPLANMYRYPDLTVYHTAMFYYIHAFFDHYVPAVFGDLLLFIFTGRTLMLKMYRKIEFLVGQFVKMAKRPWIPQMKNYRAIIGSLSKDDNEIFFMDTDNIDWIGYIEDMLVCGRRVLAHEDPSNIGYAQKKAKIWWYVTTFLKWCLILYLLNNLVSLFFPSFSFSSNVEITGERIIHTERNVLS